MFLILFGHVFPSFFFPMVFSKTSIPVKRCAKVKVAPREDYEPMMFLEPDTKNDSAIHGGDMMTKKTYGL